MSSPSGRPDAGQLPPPTRELAHVFRRLTAARGPHPLLTRKKSSSVLDVVSEQNKKRTLSAVSYLRVYLCPYCDDTNRAAGLRDWWSRRTDFRVQR